MVHLLKPAKKLTKLTFFTDFCNTFTFSEVVQKIELPSVIIGTHQIIRMFVSNNRKHS